MLAIRSELNKEKENIKINLEKYPQLNIFYDDPKQKGYDDIFKKN